MGRQTKQSEEFITTMETVLQKACHTGKTSDLEYFLRTEVALNLKLFNQLKDQFLVQAINSGRIEIVKLIMAYEPDYTIGFCYPLRSAITLGVLSGRNNTAIIEILLEKMCELVDKPGTGITEQNYGKYAMLSRAVLRNDEVAVTQLLNTTAYDSYADVIDDQKTPLCLGLTFNKQKALKPFVRAAINVENIFWSAITMGNIDLVDLCTKSPGFHPLTVRNSDNEDALIVAQRSNQMKVVNYLVMNYGLKIDGSDSCDQSTLSVKEENKSDTPSNKAIQSMALVTDCNENNQNISLDQLCNGDIELLVGDIGDIGLSVYPESNVDIVPLCHNNTDGPWSESSPWQINQQPTLNCKHDLHDPTRVARVKLELASF